MVDNNVRMEVLAGLRNTIKERFMALPEDEQDIIRANSGTPYANVLRKVLGPEVTDGLKPSAPKRASVARRGLGTR